MNLVTGYHLYKDETGYEKPISNYYTQVVDYRKDHRINHIWLDDEY